MTLYRHHKGGLYRYLGDAKHTTTGERLVIYESLDSLAIGCVWARPAVEFRGTVNVGGTEQKRFELVGEGGAQ